MSYKTLGIPLLLLKK